MNKNENIFCLNTDKLIETNRDAQNFVVIQGVSIQ